MKRLLCPLLFLALAASLALPARAHYLWIDEADGNRAVVRFGHLEENVREKSPGLIDQIPAPQAWSAVAGKTAPASAEKLPDGFALAPKKAGAGSIWAAFEDVAVFVHEGQPGTKAFGYVRWVADRAAKAEPAMALDLVPAGGNPNRFVLYFKGKPRAGAEVEVHAPNLWNRTYKTGPDGVIEIETPWPGLYVAEAALKGEAESGTFRNVPYGKANYTATLSFRQD